MGNGHRIRAAPQLEAHLQPRLDLPTAFRVPSLFAGFLDEAGIVSLLGPNVNELVLRCVFDSPEPKLAKDVLDGR